MILGLVASGCAGTPVAGSDAPVIELEIFGGCAMAGSCPRFGIYPDGRVVARLVRYERPTETTGTVAVGRPLVMTPWPDWLRWISHALSNGP